MRLDRFLSENTALTRKTAKQALHRGDVLVDGVAVKKGDIKIKDQQVSYLGQIVSEIGDLYIMLHKPQGYVCSAVDDDGLSVLHLIDEPFKNDLHIAGRLDKDTTGLVLLTNDGQWSHRITSPKSQCSKEYIVGVSEPLLPELIEQFEHGVQLKSEEKLTRPALLDIVSSHQARLTISEGKYHQVKRMFAAVGNHVATLHRSKIGAVSLESSLESGQWRHLTKKEFLSLGQ
ncbi:16S rRNA pseudouridine(516) synthase RsuA [Psychrobium sp. 1_MG-2023]|uniref:16S rRNA pseudouridine(516) synthase RsuA n=1 Tax=Psychrobium sp. 1_MG-2023 TaxID=3062624 RepID=UPI000C341A51|nr:16S rRNA pseudouridine(516) synthase RsuA [Psychrobium sp. 1_MG-2023]MDP2559957.1 16S rRNA pseudouridine(516) synthase RsuA [Psychrobium sp. 1_MG-2023]PKF56377.1 16S rRNA pseudouridine(516) synthase RsuA [Alteromonadales bacterium alter-6D02]